jgi:hypothetical protein
MKETSLFVPELKETLVGRKLDIWRGYTADGKPLDISMAKRESYISRWLRRAASEPKELVRRPCNCKKTSG